MDSTLYQKLVIDEYYNKDKSNFFKYFENTKNTFHYPEVRVFTAYHFLSDTREGFGCFRIIHRAKNPKPVHLNEPSTVEVVKTFRFYIPRTNLTRVSLLSIFYPLLVISESFRRIEFYTTKNRLTQMINNRELDIFDPDRFITKKPDEIAHLHLKRSLYNAIRKFRYVKAFHVYEYSLKRKYQNLDDMIEMCKEFKRDNKYLIRDNEYELRAEPDLNYNVMELGHVMRFGKFNRIRQKQKIVKLSKS